MAIEFARPRFIQRSRGDNVVELAAYNCRERLYCEMTGERNRGRDSSDHLYHEIMLPLGASPRLSDVGTLWNAVQAAERRKDSQEAVEYVLPLPANREINDGDRIALARSFTQEHFVSKGLAAQLDIHLPHPPKRGYLRLYRGESGGNEQNGGWFTEDRGKAALYGTVSYIDVSRDDLRRFAQGHGGPDEWLTDDAEICARPRQVLNYHAHLLTTTRRVEGDRLSSHKATDLMPKVRNLPFGKPVVAEGELWGELWRDHQNKFFSDNGKGIEVDPVAPIPSEHISPKRFRNPKDPMHERAAEVRELNAKIARDPATAAAHLSKRPVTAHLLASFFTKYIADPEEREAVAADVHTRLHNLHREVLSTASWADKVQSGLRPLSVEDIARELSPNYAALLKKAAELREGARKADWIRNRQTADKEAGEHRINERWVEMGIARRALHLVGKAFPTVSVGRDIELDRWSGLNKQGARAEERWSIRGEAISGELQVVTRQAALALEKIRPQAERELERRQKIARNARAALETLEQRDKLIRRARRSYSRGPPL